MYIHFGDMCVFPIEGSVPHLVDPHRISLHNAVRRRKVATLTASTRYTVDSVNPNLFLLRKVLRHHQQLVAPRVTKRMSPVQVVGVTSVPT